MAYIFHRRDDLFTAHKTICYCSGKSYSKDCPECGGTLLTERFIFRQRTALVNNTTFHRITGLMTQMCFEVEDLHVPPHLLVLSGGTKSLKTTADTAAFRQNLLYSIDCMSTFDPNWTEINKYYLDVLTVATYAVKEGTSLAWTYGDSIYESSKSSSDFQEIMKTINR